MRFDLWQVVGLAIMVLLLLGCNAILGLDRIVDTTSPDAPDGPQLLDAPPDGASPDASALDAPNLTSNGGTVGVPRPTIVGTCASDATVEVFAQIAGNAEQSWCVATCVEAQFSCEPTSDRPEATYSVTVDQYIVAGERSPRSAPISLTIAFDVDPAPTISVPGNGALLNSTENTVNVEGACTDAQTVTVVDNNQAFCTTPCNSGAYICGARTFTHGVHQLIAGQTGTIATSIVNFTVDTVAPAPPSITSPAAWSAVPTGRPTFTGTCEAGAQVTVKAASTGITFCTGDCIGGAFSCTKNMPILPDGNHNVRAHQVDGAQNSSTDSTVHPFVVNTWDDDGDIYPDVVDNCPHTSNPDQTLTDQDGDGVGDACEGPPGMQSIVAYLPFRFASEYVGWNPMNVEIYAGKDLMAGGNGSLIKTFATGISGMQVEYFFFPANNNGSIELTLSDPSGAPFASCVVERAQMGDQETTLNVVTDGAADSRNQGALDGPLQLYMSSNYVACAAHIQGFFQVVNVLSPFAPALYAPTLELRLTGAAKLRYLLVIRTE